MKNFLYLVLIISIAACTKSSDEQPLTEQSLLATWRMEAQRTGADTLNPNGWWPLNYNKQQSDFDIYCVYDSRINESFLSRVNCAYDISPGTGIGVPASDCARTVFMRDTVWAQLLRLDWIFSADHNFNWYEQLRLSRALNTINQHCSSPTYIPEHDDITQVPGQWQLDQAANTLTIDYSPGYSRIDGAQVNQFKVISFTGDVLVLKLISDGSEYRFRKV